MKLLPETLKAIGRYVIGVTEIVVVDDSPKSEVFHKLVSPTKVIPLEGVGCYKAMEVVRQQMSSSPYSCFWEEDCIPIKEINLMDFAIELSHSGPHMVQLAFGRQPTYPEEIKAGSVAKFLMPDAIEWDMISGPYNYVKQDTVFTGNPSVWGPGAVDVGPWPQCDGHEAVRTAQLVERGDYFGYTVEQLIEHVGEREGFGY
jgi:hypothetical protein